MTRNDFLLKLEEKGIPTNVVCFDTLKEMDDVFYIRNEYNIWKVSYIERGKELDLKCFPTESEGLMYLYKKL